MLKLWGKLLGLSDLGPGKTGSRELAVTVAMFAIFMIFWWEDSLSPEGKKDIVFYLIVAAVVCLMGAFGLKAMALGLLNFGSGNQNQIPGEGDINVTIDRSTHNAADQDPDEIPPEGGYPEDRK